LTSELFPQVADKPTFPELWPDVVQFVEKLTRPEETVVLLAHNASFDVRLVQQSLGGDRHSKSSRGSNWHYACTVKLSRAIWPDRSVYRLTSLSADFGLEHEDAHRAMADTEV
jgi:DNA polymerase-3 subunit epsilon